MTENELRQYVAKTAQNWLGAKESNGTHKPIIDVYNAHKPLARGYAVKYTDAWCATFVSAVAIKCGLTAIMPTECSCPYMINGYKALGRWVETDSITPSVGDVIFYDWDDSGNGDNAGTSDHVGIVTAVNGSTMTIIEGNISNSVGTRTLAVNSRYIRGYGCPDYAKKAGAVDSVAPAETSTNNATYTVQKGDTLWGLAEKWLGDGLRYPEIAEYNGLKTNNLSVGQTLKIPGATKEETKAPAAKEACSVSLAVLREGDTGGHVESMQYLLMKHGYGLPNYGPDGEIGAETLAALKAFQKAEGLTIDGVCGCDTWAALHN